MSMVPLLSLSTKAKLSRIFFISSSVRPADLKLILTLPLRRSPPAIQLAPMQTYYTLAQIYQRQFNQTQEELYLQKKLDLFLLLYVGFKTRREAPVFLVRN
mmetsp:Transcript_18331/g.25412  ORF Transcript_18331/g.25412 Transcript_18331/m.25412 type:complete len:101 (+) Transcript_18331:427-729(+)